MSFSVVVTDNDITFTTLELHHTFTTPHLHHNWAEKIAAGGKINGIKPFIKADTIFCISSGDIDKLGVQADTVVGKVDWIHS